MVKSIAAQVRPIISVNQRRLLALSRMSFQDVVDQAQLPVAKGGRMRVDTGFLRASGQASLNGLPTGLIRGEGERDYDFDETSTVLTLAKFRLGMTLFFGWTANYARARNLRDGFLDVAVQNWKQIVKKNVQKIRRAIR